MVINVLCYKCYNFTTSLDVSSKCPTESLNSLETETRPPQQPPPLAVPFSSMKVEAINKASFLAELKKTKPPTTRTPARNVRRCLPKKLVKEIEELLRANPSGIWLSKFVEEFQVSFYSNRASTALLALITFAKIKIEKLKLVLVNTHDPCQNAIVRLQRVSFFPFLAQFFYRKMQNITW